MTTMVISTLTFSWCEQASTVAPAEVTPTGPLSIQNLGTSTGQYEFGSKSMSPRSPAMLDFPHGSIARVPSTLTTVIIPSLSNEDAPIASATPDCRYQDQLGNKTLNFDDFPLGPPRPLSEYSPVHHFYFAGGFAVVPPVLDTFKPSSGDLMLQFTPSSISNTTEDGISPDTAKIDVGAQMFTTCFSFNFTGVNLGCDSKLLPCSFSLTGFKYDPSAGLLERASQTFTIPAYPSNGNSALTPVTIFNFTDLTTITLKAEADGKPTIWYADDFTFGWFDNTCDAGLCRSRLPDGIQRRD
ncbi:hypothetical protein GGR50DRAFT_686768 [Xylaria sp. CBS 124048]|nr:hypothetical protein GGR50DRAFT_686768 [Xylaria sp. CBS 124048]